jgi:titin
MWIAYGKAKVGYSANYVVYSGSTPPTPPTAPTNLTATAASYSQINLAWADNATDETGFYIERCTGVDCSDFAQIATVGANVTSYSNTSLAASTSYSYRVRAYNGAGDSDYTNIASAMTSALPAPPTAPTSLTATATSYSQINLAWADNATDETGFYIERCTGVDCSDFAQIATVGANVTSYSNTGLVASTSYSYRVRAYNTGGVSGYSNTATAVTQSTPAVPAAPSNLTASAVSRSQINLAWMDNASNESGFYIERCRGSTCTNFTQIATVGANVTSFADTGLIARTTYRYRVRAYNDSGNSAYSNIAKATTKR